MPETPAFTFNHTMLRVKDPQLSLAFYRDIFGMALLRTVPFPEYDFTLYFLAGGAHAANAPAAEASACDGVPRERWLFGERGILELTHNHGTEHQKDFCYHDGNAEPQGFGHICFSVPDLDAACRWMDDHAVEFIKRPDEGGLKGVAFVRDPDGYWIELVEPARIASLVAST
ncbi:MAG: lactoylglutathione lyase [Thioalkalivibrionaceae bacterium]